MVLEGGFPKCQFFPEIQGSLGGCCFDVVRCLDVGEKWHVVFLFISKSISVDTVNKCLKLGGKGGNGVVLPLRLREELHTSLEEWQQRGLRPRL